MSNLRLREKTASVKRQHILEAAIRVFSARGFHRATIREVAVEAGVADGTIYTVFKNKTALLLGILDARPGSPVPEPSATHPVDPEAMICGLIARQWEAFTPETLAMMRVVLSEVLIDADLRRLYCDQVIAPALTLPEASLAGLVASGRLVSTDVAMTIRMLTATFLGLVMLRLLGDDRLERDADHVPEILSALLLDGMRPRRDGEG